MDWLGLSNALAQNATGGSTGVGGGAGAALSSPLFVMVPIMVIFYFLLIRPQQKKQKELKAMLENLKKDDVVVTQGGIQGKITGLTDQVVTLEIAEKVRVKLQRGYIVSVVSRGESASE
jgi:preprotein translocase subunit YajC